MSRRAMLFAVALVVVITSGIGAYRWWHNRPPFVADAIQPTALVDPLESSADNQVHSLYPGGPVLLAGAGAQMLRGEVRWKLPAGVSPDWREDGRFTVVVLDKRVGLKPPNILGMSPSGVEVLSGGDGVLNKVAEKYSWLRGAGDIRVGENSWNNGGDTLSVSPAAGSVKFLAHFPKIKAGTPERQFLASAPIAQSDLLIALVYIGPDRQIFWASRLYG